MKEIQEDLKENLNNEQTIVVACSGGPDSMCLLHLLIEYRYENPIKIICAHVNHNVRPESAEELEFVKQYCRDNDIKFVSNTLRETNTSEVNLRQKRYDFLFATLKKYNSQLLLTAHHGDDLVETILMRLTRGSNLNGFGGFRKLTKYKNYCIYRPLICLTKKEIELYNQKYNIPSVHDTSNDSDNFTRNRYRHHVLPFLKEENKNVHQKFYEFSQEMYQCSEIIDDITNCYFQNNYHNNRLDISNFSTLHQLIQKKVLEKYLSALYVDNLDLINKKHLELLLDIVNNKTNSQIDLPNNITIFKEYNLLISDDLSTISSEYQFILEEKQLLPNKYILEIINSSEEQSNYVIRINSSEIKLPLIVRTRKNADRMMVKNLKGTKKLQDIFTDCKVPKSLRASYPVVTDSNDKIIWLPGLKKSKFDKEINEKYDIIIKYYSSSINKGEKYE